MFVNRCQAVWVELEAGCISVFFLLVVAYRLVALSYGCKLSCVGALTLV